MQRVTVITGASSGIGAALSEKLAADGDIVALVARRQDPLEALAKKIIAAGGKAHVFVADVANRDDIRAVFTTITETLGQIDTLVANAGIGDSTPASAFDAERVERIIRVNLMGVVYCIEAVLPDMQARRSGHIVGVGSLAGYRGLPGSGAYCASKAGLASLLESLRIELRPVGVDVSLICPGFVRTPLTERNHFPMPFILELDDATNRIHGAIRRKRSEYAFPWALAFPVRLARFIPNWLYDRLLSKQKADKVPLEM